MSEGARLGPNFVVEGASHHWGQRESTNVTRVEMVVTGELTDPAIVEQEEVLVVLKERRYLKEGVMRVQTRDSGTSS